MISMRNPHIHYYWNQINHKYIKLNINQKGIDLKDEEIHSFHIAFLTYFRPCC
jgi:hypothetical protein